MKYSFSSNGPRQVGACLGLLFFITCVVFGSLTNSNATMVMQGGSRYAIPESGGGDADLNPSYNTLTLQIPRRTGTAGIGGSSGLETTFRPFRTYPGIEYTIPVTWWGGSYPIVGCTLTNAPAGMVCEQYTMADGTQGWQIRWPNPTTDANDIGIEIEDTLGATDTGEWDIDVTTTDMFFVDSVNDGSGDTGTLAAPFDTLEQARQNTTGYSFLYFRAGTYTVVESSGTDTGNDQMEWTTSTRATNWIGYPGETVTIDHGGGTYAPMIRFNETGAEAAAWLQNLNFIGGDEFGVYLDQAHQYGSVLWKLTFDNYGPASPGGETNQAIVTTQHVSVFPIYGFTVVSVEMSDLDTHCALKFYDTSHSHIVGNYVHDTTNRTDSGLFALKGNVPHMYMMSNKFENVDAAPIGGDWATDFPGSGDVGGEFGYNVFLDGYDTTVGATNAVVMLRDGPGPRQQSYFYRNTFVGNILMESYVSTDGAVLFHRNVMINGDGANTPVNWLFDYNGSTALDDKTTLTENITNASSSGILDANGLLTGASRTASGPGSGDDTGHELQLMLPLFGMALRGRRRYRRAPWAKDERAAA
jgi:hypothetical protein